MKIKKKQKNYGPEHDKNYSREELNILAKAAGIQYYSKYKKHELALKLGVGNCEWKNLKNNNKDELRRTKNYRSRKEGNLK